MKKKSTLSNYLRSLNFVGSLKYDALNHAIKVNLSKRAIASHLGGWNIAEQLPSMRELNEKFPCVSKVEIFANFIRVNVLEILI
jgi:hypothetical protein